MAFRLNPLTGKLDFYERYLTEVVPVTINAVKVWQAVPVTIGDIIDAQAYDAFNSEKVEIDIRINSGILEIRSNKITTYTIRIIGE